MNEERFVTDREPDWQKLVHLCDRADASPTFLNSEDFQELIRCYRRASGDLARVRTMGSNPELTLFLNDTVARAHGILYRSKRKSIGVVLGEMLALVAQTGRRRKWFILGSAMAFLIGAVVSCWLIDAVPATKSILLPPQMAENARSWTDGMDPRTAGESAMATGFYATNNPQAALMTVSLSAVTFGVGGAFEIYENAVNVGALAHEMRNAGKLGLLIVWLLPHGVSEISGLFVACGAGFCLAGALINPGRRKRGEALAQAGKDAMVLMAFSVVMMFIAAPFEGYFSFNPRIPNAVKLMVAILVASAWAAFWIGYGRERSDPEPLSATSPVPTPQ